MKFFPAATNADLVGETHSRQSPPDHKIVTWSGAFGFMDFTPAEAREVARMLVEAADQIESTP